MKRATERELRRQVEDLMRCCDGWRLKTYRLGLELAEARAQLADDRLVAGLAPVEIPATDFQQIMKQAIYGEIGDLGQGQLRILELAQARVITRDEAATVIDAAYARGRVGIGGACDLTEWARDQILMGVPCADVVATLANPKSALVRIWDGRGDL